MDDVLRCCIAFSAVAEAFLATPEAEGFALAGGAALIATGVVDRTTDDLDMFIAEPRAVRAAVDAFMLVARARDCPTLSIEELAADKVLARFGQAEARDFVDVYVLAKHLPPERMFELAAEKDGGFDPYQLAVSIGRLDHHPRTELDIDDEGYVALRAFFTDLRRRLIERTIDPPQ